MVPVPTAQDDNVTQCIFCERDVKVVTLNLENGQVDKYTKEQAKKDYVKFLNELKEKSEVAKILTKERTKE
jgi:hypothetical protein